MNNNTEVVLDFDLLLFYLLLAVGSFAFYMLRHPFISFMIGKAVYNPDLFAAYILDLLIFLAVIIPYIIFILVLVIYKAIYQKKIADSFFVVLFFPLIGFFTKGLSLVQVYSFASISEIVKDNIIYGIFILLGPIAVLLHRFIIFLWKKRKQNGGIQKERY